MPNIKIGDRVKVAPFEGVVAGIYGSTVDVDGGGDKYANVGVGLVSIVVSPPKIGDRVTADNVADLPIATVVQNDLPDGGGITVRKLEASYWRGVGKNAAHILDSTVHGWEKPVIVFLPRSA